MRMHLEEGLAVGWTIHGFKAAERAACFAIKLTYKLQNGRPPVLADEPEPMSGDIYCDDDLSKSLLYPADLVAFKPRADVVVLATAHAPAKRAVPHFSVRIKVGPLNKTLTVFGPRTWRRELFARTGATEPQSFTSLSITYENAFGGPNSKKNPLGRGVESEDLPQIEDPRHLLTSARDKFDPAGFGAIAASWQPRADMVGKYDERWRKEHWPWFPENFDYGYFNAAPRDQQIEGYLKGNEELLFENLHPEHAIYRSSLPSLRSRCFLQERETNGQLDFREVPLNLDTLWVDLNVEKMVLVWRGHVPVRTMKMKEVEKILAWTEPLSDSPRPTSYCSVFLADCQRADEAVWEMESPEAVAAAKAEEAAADARFEKAFAEFDKDMAAADAEITEAAAALENQWATQKAQMIANGVDPALLEPPSASQSASETLRATIKEMQAKSPEDAALLQQQLAEVEQLEAESAAMDKEFAAEFPPAATRDDILAAIARRESMAKRDLIEMDLTGQDLSGLDFEGALLTKAILKGANFQNAHLKDANLRKADMSGADLSGAILDGADLNGANLAGAKLAGLALNGTDLSELNLAGADFTGSSGKSADFSGSDLTRAKLIGVKLPAADFSKSKLEGADFRYAELPRADLDGAKAAHINLEGTDLTKISASSGADFTEGNFKGAKAAGAVFGEAILDRTNFSRAILVRAQFSDASLQGAVFDRADLSLASFDGANLHKAVLTKANLIRAGFDQADLTEADLRGSNLYEAGFWEAILDKADFRNANVKGTGIV